MLVRPCSLFSERHEKNNRCCDVGSNRWWMLFTDRESWVEFCWYTIHFPWKQCYIISIIMLQFFTLLGHIIFQAVKHSVAFININKNVHHTYTAEEFKVPRWPFSSFWHQTPQASASVQWLAFPGSLTIRTSGPSSGPKDNRLPCCVIIQTTASRDRYWDWDLDEFLSPAPGEIWRSV